MKGRRKEEPSNITTTPRLPGRSLHLFSETKKNGRKRGGFTEKPRLSGGHKKKPFDLRATPLKKKAATEAQKTAPRFCFEKRKGGTDRSWDDARTGVLLGVPGAQGAFEDWMARWFPRFASRIAFRCVLHPRESRDIRRRELFRGFSFLAFFRVLGWSTLPFFSPPPGEGRERERGEDFSLARKNRSPFQKKNQKK